ncbi:MAG TPA: hypothetical protein ENH90_02135 [bacterium]|nr:hypothetical protein [bacterium]
MNKLKKIWDEICRIVLTFLTIISAIALLISLFAIPHTIQNQTFTPRILLLVFLLSLLIAVLLYATISIGEPWGIKTRLEKIIDRIEKDDLEKMGIITELAKIKG